MESSQKPESKAEKPDWYMAFAKPGWMFLNAAYKLDISGEENIPEGPSMILANHVKFIDSFIIAGAYAHFMKRPARLAAKAGYWQGTGVDDHGKLGRSMKWFVENTRQIPVDREDATGAAKSLSLNLKQLFQKDKESAVFHGEGTRPVDGHLYDFKPGAARFAITNKVPILGASIDYTERTGMLRDVAHLHFFPPLLPPDYDIEYPHYRILNNKLATTLGRATMSPAAKAAQVNEHIVQQIAEQTGRPRAYETLDLNNRQDKKQ